MTPEHLSLTIPQRPDDHGAEPDPAGARAAFLFELDLLELRAIIPSATPQPQGPREATAVSINSLAYSI